MNKIMNLFNGSSIPIFSMHLLSRNPEYWLYKFNILRWRLNFWPMSWHSVMFPIHICMISEHIPAPLPGEVTDRPLRSCSPPPNIKGGFYSPPAVHYEDGANVTFTCDERRTLMGNATISCRGGLWHPATPVCRMNREFIKQCSSI